MRSSDEQSFSKLTAREIEFLILYDEPLLIKEIAFRCRVREPTVHKALESARRKLSTRTSREAARLVTAQLAREKTLGRFHTLGEPPNSGKVAPSDPDPERHVTVAVPAVEERRSSSPARSWGVLSVLWGGGETLTPRERIAAIVLLAFMIVIASGVLVMIGRGLGYTVAAIVYAFR